MQQMTSWFFKTRKQETEEEKQKQIDVKYKNFLKEIESDTSQKTQIERV